MKRKLLTNVFVYGAGWLVIAGLNLLAHRFLRTTFNLWDVTWTVAFAAFLGWLSDWLISQRMAGNSEGKKKL